MLPTGAPLSHGQLNPDSIRVEAGLIRIKIRVTTLLARWVQPTCIRVTSVLKMAGHGLAWSDEEVTALLDV